MSYVHKYNKQGGGEGWAKAKWENVVKKSLDYPICF